MSGHIIRCFLDSDLRSSHDGLADQAKKSGIKVEDLKQGEYVVFVNSKKDRVKVYAAYHVLAYIKLPAGTSMDLNVIRAIPKAFTASGRLDYNKALRETVEEKLVKERKLGVLELKAV
jgi:hypothetical protein